MDEHSQTPALSDPDDAFQRMVMLLKAKDDTSRFVGLALLKSVLDNQTQLRENPERIRTLWESLSPKFIDRLLKSRQNPKLPNTESRDMVDLAVAILHTFAVLLPAEARAEKRLIGRTGPLINSMVQSSPETTTLILQTLLTIVSQLEGALELLKIEDLSPLIEIAPQQSIALDILYYAWSNASTDPGESRNVIRQVDGVLPKLLLSFKGTDGVTLLNFMGMIIPKLTFETTKEPKWLRPLIQLLRNLVTSRPTPAGRSAYTILAAAILQAFPKTIPQLLFKDSTTTTTKPFSYLFINLLLIDIRSTFPSLLSKINTPEYPSISQRLSSAFDTISAFIGYLVKSLDPENDSGMSLTMPPDLLLKLRKEISETLSLTIEYLRDRYDASIAGAAGLDPSARSKTSITSSGSLLTLPWDTIQESSNVTQDAIILAGLRTLAIWLHEDENENLRNESAALMDLFMDLYTASSAPDSAVNFRDPVLTALEGILLTGEGVAMFLGQNGWGILSGDLNSIIRNPSETDSISECARGIEIVRVLLVVLDHEESTIVMEEWMDVVDSIAGVKVDTEGTRYPVVVEFQVALLQLATALFLNASQGMVKRYRGCLTAILGVARQLSGKGDLLDGELRNEVEDVILGLEGVR